VTFIHSIILLNVAGSVFMYGVIEGIMKKQPFLL